MSSSATNQRSQGISPISIDGGGFSASSHCMPRTARHAPGGMIFHVLNRGNARDEIFEKEAERNPVRPTLVDRAEKW